MADTIYYIATVTWNGMMMGQFLTRGFRPTSTQERVLTLVRNEHNLLVSKMQCDLQAVPKEEVPVLQKYIRCLFENARYKKEFIGTKFEGDGFPNHMIGLTRPLVDQIIRQLKTNEVFMLRRMKYVPK